MLVSILTLLLLSPLALCSPLQNGQTILHSDTEAHIVDEAVLAAIKTHSDPVDALVSLQPDTAAVLAEPRLLHIIGQPEPQWMTEGDKLRLRRLGQKFIDITDHEDFFSQQLEAWAGKAYLPDFKHQSLVKSLFPYVSTHRMHHVLKHMTGYYNRFYGGTSGAMSAQWLHDHIAQIIDNSPFGTHISLEYFTHSFPQSSIIARFEPKVRNFTHPLTIIGAHQDSANYLFPLLPAPGADDDCSGTVSILEAFRVLAESGYNPKNGPVEFHWYAAEEGGLLGSMAVARYKKDSGAKIGAMMEFEYVCFYVLAIKEFGKPRCSSNYSFLHNSTWTHWLTWRSMTAYIAKKANESIGFITTKADDALTKWAVDLGKEYISIPTEMYELPLGGSDYMSFTMYNYPSAFASEGNPKAHGGFPGDYNPHIHGVGDTMDVDDDAGIFSIDHMARFSELAIAFAVEQGGWDNSWR